MTAAILEQNVEQKRPSHFFFLRDRIEQEIARSIASFGEKNKLRDACEYALTNGGKRFRPLIVYLVAEALGNHLNVADAALSVEFFHTASLVVDDLPCMDNDEERRDKPSVHKVYGETIALLSSYALITAAFGKIHSNVEQMREIGSPYSASCDRIGSLALESAAHCAGILGATGGQFYDMFPPQFTLESIRQLIHKKTVTLFLVSFVFGWLFGGGDPSQLGKVKKMACHFGMAFQIADDLNDFAQDEKMGRDSTLARFVCKERAYGVVEEEMRALERELRELKLDTPSFQKMQQILRSHLR
jgi:geranylgeranyl diphosphate synthase, type II